MPEKRKVYQYNLHKKGFEFYGKEFMFVIFMESVRLLFYDEEFIVLIFHETIPSLSLGSFRYSAYFKNKTQFHGVEYYQ